MQEREISEQPPAGDIVAGASPGLVAVPLHRREQLARIARRISTESLTAELAAERGDWAAIHAAYERLTLLFAEYRLCYVQCLASKEPQ